MLSHLHSRWNKNINLGACLGFEVNNDVKVSYLAGGSILFGKDRKFILNIGVAFSRVEVLSKVNEAEIDLPISTVAIAMTKIWKPGIFYGITYNF